MREGGREGGKVRGREGEGREGNVIQTHIPYSGLFSGVQIFAKSL